MDIKKNKKYSNEEHSITEDFFRAGIGLIFSFKASLISYIPKFGKYIAFPLYSFLAASYAFEYKWGKEGLPMYERLDLFQQNASYMLTFGALTGISIFISNSGLALIYYTITFPQLMLATQNCRFSSIKNIPIAVFSPSIKAATYLKNQAKTELGERLPGLKSRLERDKKLI